MYIKLRLIFGLNNVVHDKDSTIMLEQQEKIILRKIVKLIGKASTKPLMLILIPIMNTIHALMFSLFHNHNMWIKATNEATRIMYKVLNDNSLKIDYWIRKINKKIWHPIIPSINELKEIEPPSKSEYRKKSLIFINKNDFKFGENPEFSQYAESINKNRALSLTIKYLCAEYPIP